MYILKVTNIITGNIEKSDFKTEQECVAHKEYLANIGYKFDNEQKITPAYDEVIPAYDEVIPAYDEVIPLWYETIPAEYDINNIEIEPEQVIAHPEQVVHHDEAVVHHNEVIIHHDEVVLNIAKEYNYEILVARDAFEDLSPRQIRLALLSCGVTEEHVHNAILNMIDPQKSEALIAWEHSTSFVRDTEAVTIIGGLLGFTSEQLDQLWINGKLL